MTWERRYVWNGRFVGGINLMARIRVCRWLLWRSLLAGWIADKTSHVILVILKAVMEKCEL